MRRFLGAFLLIGGLIAPLWPAPNEESAHLAFSVGGGVRLAHYAGASWTVESLPLAGAWRPLAWSVEGEALHLQALASTERLRVRVADGTILSPAPLPPHPVPTPESLWQIEEKAAFLRLIWGGALIYEGTPPLFYSLAPDRAAALLFFGAGRSDSAYAEVYGRRGKLYDSRQDAPPELVATNGEHVWAGAWLYLRHVTATGGISSLGVQTHTGEQRPAPSLDVVFVEASPDGRWGLFVGPVWYIEARYYDSLWVQDLATGQAFPLVAGESLFYTQDVPLADLFVWIGE